MENKQNTYQLRTSQKIYLPFKRIIGVFGSILGIVVCLVLLWWWAIPVNAIATNGHPFFNRHRIGKNGKPFVCFKFRTMKLDTDPHLSSTGSDRSCHLTKFGKFLRISSIDETPQLFNILIGQMAFIGPRPLINVNEEDIKTISKRKENGSINIRPGISGYAQINGRETVDPVKKAEFDGYYYTHFSFMFDAKIFVKTIAYALFLR